MIESNQPIKTSGFGDPSKPPLLFLHGWLGHPDDWNPMVKHLTHTFYCICVSIPHQLTFDQFNEVFFHLTSQYSDKANSIFAYGYSLGGRLLSQFVAQYPDCFDAVIIESAHLGLVDGNARKKRWLLDQKRQHDFLSNPGNFLDNWYQLPIWGPMAQHSRYPIYSRQKKERLSNPTSTKHMADVLENFSLAVQKPVNIETLNLPMLFIYGEHDTKYADLYQPMPSFYTSKSLKRLCKIKGAYHNPHWSHPKACVEAILSFSRPLLKPPS